MPDKAVYLLVVDGFADWEPAHALAVLRRHGAYRVEAVGLSREVVTSMGGLRVVPSCRIADVVPEDVGVFIMPGGERWETTPIEGVLEAKLKELDARRVPIAAICAATVAIAKIGLLRGRRHTSNGLEYLRSHAPDYREEQHYVAVPAVRDAGLITASGVADVEFARELFDELGVLSEGDRTIWAEMFRTAQLPDGAS